MSIPQSPAKSGSMATNNETATSSSPTFPDAMNQSIFQMMMSQHKSPTLPISQLYQSPEKAHFDNIHSTSTSNTSTNNNFKPIRFDFLPYPIPFRAAGAPPPEPDFSFVGESCAGKVGVGIFGGYVCGLLMGVFMGAMSDMTPPVTVYKGKEIPQAPLKEQMRTTMRATGEKCIYWSRNFAFITGVFSGSDCLVEKYRGTHDVYNSVISGCITGAAMQAKQGPQAAAIGCGGFAAFSLVIDKVMGTH